MQEEEEQNDERDLYEHHVIEVDAGQELLRIDRYLMARLPKTSRNRIQNETKAGNIKVNDEVVKVNYKVRVGDIVSVLLPYPKRNLEVTAEDIPLNIVYEDDEVVIINKQAGLVVHPGFGNFDGTLVNGLLHHFGKLPSASEFETRPGLVHRLDKNTTGLMVVAKTDRALSHLGKEFFDRTAKRKYIAFVWGDLLDEEGTIEGHIGRSLKNRKLMSVFEEGDYGYCAEFGQPIGLKRLLVAPTASLNRPWFRRHLQAS